MNQFEWLMDIIQYIMIMFKFVVPSLLAHFWTQL